MIITNDEIASGSSKKFSFVTTALECTTFCGRILNQNLDHLKVKAPQTEATSQYMKRTPDATSPCLYKDSNKV